MLFSLLGRLKRSKTTVRTAGMTFLQGCSGSSNQALTSGFSFIGAASHRGPLPDAPLQSGHG